MLFLSRITHISIILVYDLGTPMHTPQILIVEDEQVTRNTLKTIFEAEGYTVFEAINGDNMHQILSEDQINLVIMDINLPGKKRSITCKRTA